MTGSALQLLAAAAAAFAVRYRLRRPMPFRAIAWSVGPILLGVGGLLLLSLVGFGQASVAPKRYPISLARSIADGPGLWHLQAKCGDYRYAVCEVFPNAIPTNPGDFLWGENGVRYRATPAQMERIPIAPAFARLRKD